MKSTVYELTYYFGTKDYHIIKHECVEKKRFGEHEYAIFKTKSSGVNKYTWGMIDLSSGQLIAIAQSKKGLIDYYHKTVESFLNEYFYKTPQYKHLCNVYQEIINKL